MAETPAASPGTAVAIHWLIYLCPALFLLLSHHWPPQIFSTRHSACPQHLFVLRRLNPSGSMYIYLWTIVHAISSSAIVVDASRFVPTHINDRGHSADCHCVLLLCGNKTSARYLFVLGLTYQPCKKPGGSPRSRGLHLYSY